MKKLITLLFISLYLSGCASINLKLKSSDNFIPYKVYKHIYDNSDECKCTYFLDNNNINEDNTNTISFPCSNIINSTRNQLHFSHGPNNENVWLELTDSEQKKIIINDHRSYSDKEKKDIMKDMEKNGRDCRVVKIEATDQKGVFKIWFKDGVNVDAETLEYEFSQWIEGDKNVVKKNDATGDILVILNPETSNNLKNSQE